ncbi:trna (guanine -n)-dimethyltransferase [Cystoisospora suis]|uniref:tRNA (guanine(26)-N(2))-dimethyltransferase n=1 Tax=Cystoisospora suis TaxID=483139 RepID=A0A2C6LD77_9APIC|nr:trna (guanine -n)-dimethyltransferase [Cystoisospora suis]
MGTPGDAPLNSVGAVSGRPSPEQARSMEAGSDCPAGRAAFDKASQETLARSPQHDGDTSKFIREGKVCIYRTTDNDVFYNPVQIFNRDLSVLAIKAFALRQKEEIKRRGRRTAERAQQEGKQPPPLLEFSGLTVLEPLAATGLRSLRYLAELQDEVVTAVANDLDPHAVDTIERNVALNGLPANKLYATCSEGARLMYALATPGNLQHGTIKKIHSLPPGSSVPSSFDMTPPASRTFALPPLFLFLSSECSLTHGSVAGKGSLPGIDGSGRSSSNASSWRGSEGADGQGSLPQTTVPAAQASFSSSIEEDSGGTVSNGSSGRRGCHGCYSQNDGKCVGQKSDLPVFFDVVDVDPYGSVAPFLDAAVQAVRPGGLVCLTSTDMPVLCGNAPDVTFYKYGGAALKGKYMHEMAVRLVVYAATASAAKYKRTVVPLLSCSVDFYVRLFLQVFESPEGCKDVHSNSAVVHQCIHCDFFRVIGLGAKALASSKQSGTAEPCSDRSAGCRAPKKRKSALLPEDCSGTCPECGGRLTIGGPFYSGPLYQQEFLHKCLGLCEVAKEVLPGLTMVPRIRGLLTAMSEELMDVPLYYHLPTLCNRMKLEMLKPALLKSALIRLGYRVSHFHRDPQAIKTDAPSTVVFDILRTHGREHPPKHPGESTLLHKEIVTQGIVLAPVSGATSPSTNVPKWLPNPTSHWGPKSRATSKKRKNDSYDRLASTKNQIDNSEQTGNPLVC